MTVLITTCISYQSNIVLAFYLIIYCYCYYNFLTKLGRIIVKRPRTIIWVGRYIRNKLLLLHYIIFL